MTKSPESNANPPGVFLLGVGAQKAGTSWLHQQLHTRGAKEACVCWGSADTYNIVQPDEAATLLRIKANDLQSTGAGLIESANIGCTLQLRQQLGETTRSCLVRHPM